MNVSKTTKQTKIAFFTGLVTTAVAMTLLAQPTADAESTVNAVGVRVCNYVPYSQEGPLPWETLWVDAYNANGTLIGFTHRYNEQSGTCSTDRKWMPYKPGYTYVLRCQLAVGVGYDDENVLDATQSTAPTGENLDFRMTTFDGKCHGDIATQPG